MSCYIIILTDFCLPFMWTHHLSAAAAENTKYGQQLARSGGMKWLKAILIQQPCAAEYAERRYA